MFEQALEDSKSIVTVESGMYQTVTASNVGVSPLVVFCGSKEYTFSEASAAIKALDVAMFSCAKSLYKRIRATRMQFVFAFGPDMLALFPSPPACASHREAA